MATEAYIADAGSWRSLKDGHSKTSGASARFPGDPGNGVFYVGWDQGPKPEGALSNGISLSPAPLSVYHAYSTATHARVQDTHIDTAITNNMIASQSFKLDFYTPSQITAGSADADIAASITICRDRTPWPIWLCYVHEPEDNFTSSTSASQYRAAFRYIVQKFRDAGVTNVAWQTILQDPWTFLTTTNNTGGDGDLLDDNSSSGGSGRDWRWWHPDWKGTNNRNSTDWYTGADRMIDMIGLDLYNPMPPASPGPGTSRSFQTFLEYALNDIEAVGTPTVPYTLPEFGMSKWATPYPNWLDWCNAAITVAKARNVICFGYWNHSGDAHRYDFDTAVGDIDGTKLLGWEAICNASVACAQGGA